MDTSPMTPTPSPASSGDSSRNFLAVSILTAAIIIGGSILYSNGALRSGYTAQVAPALAAPTIDDDVVLGSANAPVTLIVFVDYQCPFCKQMYDDTEARLRQDYVATGKLKVVYRDFPLERIHPVARASAEAAECTRDQGAYVQAHDYFFDHQQDLPSFAADKFADIPAALGIDAASFNACVASGKYSKEVSKDLSDGIAAGVTGTPASFVNGALISGAVPYETFVSAIEAALAKR